MFSELAFPHIRCCLSGIPSDLMKCTAVDESLPSMSQQFCSRENQLLQIGKCNLPHIWDRVLLNTPGHNLKRHVQAIGHANPNQPNTPTHLNQPNIPKHLGQPNSTMQFFTGSEHVHRTS